MPQIELFYEDAHILVCRKPVGVNAQGDAPTAMPALLQAQCGGTVYPVHRLDQPVGGVMVYARTQQSAASLTAAMQQSRFYKEYRAVLSAPPQQPQGTLEDLLFFDRTRNQSFVCKRPRGGVKQARLHYTALAQAADGSATRTLVRVCLETGRTHQIRVQFASRGCPLLGDGKYGSRDNRCTAALYAAVLRFPHPVTETPLTFTAAPPQTFPWTLFPDALSVLEKQQ